MNSMHKLVVLALVTLLLSSLSVLAQDDVPEIVNVPGTIQPELGCPGEWAPDCEATFLEYVEEYDIWERTFESLPAGSYEYKVALDGGWDENYGAFGDPGGPNIAMTQPEDGTITFLYDDATNWIMDTARQRIVTAPGSYQDEVGCSGEWMPDCMVSWLQDIDGDGIYNYTTSAIPPGDYETKAAIGRTWDESYGLEGGDANIPFTVSSEGEPVTFTFDSNLNVMVISVGGGSISEGNLRQQTAYWLLGDTLGWDIEADPDADYQLLYSQDAAITVSLFGLEGDFESISLTASDAGLPETVVQKFPHLADLTAFTIAEEDMALVPEVLQGQIAVAAFKNDNLIDLAGLQIPGVLDDLYATDVPLGATFDDDGVPTLTVWAPTAQDVSLNLYADSDPASDATVIEMSYDGESGTWGVTGDADWYGQYYTYNVTVFAPTEQAIVINEVTDPYSVSLSQNSLRTQIIDLSDSQVMPDGWMSLEKPELDAPEDITLYELHIRDFSALDETVPEELRGTYMAFTLEDSNGVNHLQALSDAGLTHLHLLPSFDIATINENRARWAVFAPDYDELAALPPDSDQQQALIAPTRDLDGFNWGYDPYHYNTPEGSYSTDPDSTARITEYRQMVQALNEMGLRVVQDVVYNHTNASGQETRSVLDRIVPGYYHRLNSLGRVETSTCCRNTATEHDMMRRLMIDSIILYTTQYKIDGFRFDLMGHHMLADMVAVRDALDSLTLEDDGVDGTQVYVYGEGWDFGEVSGNQRGVTASQLDLAGTGIGSFNDRLRDAVRGGSPVAGDRYLEQGIANGLFTDPTDLHPANSDLDVALNLLDNVRVGLAANLSDYPITNATGDAVSGFDISYNNAPAAYTVDPQENILYASAHDNQTVFDLNIIKAPRDTDMATRVRQQLLSLSYPMYGQGVPFFHAGSDILRSKSLDNDSFNSGDWFNLLDFSYQTNNFGVGLPPAWAGGNQDRWEIMGPLLANPDNIPTADDITFTAAEFQRMLRVRYSTPLFRLRTGGEVIERVDFHNTGTEQIPGLIVMSISDMIGDDLDPAHQMVVVAFNARPETTEFSVEALTGLEMVLHPELAASSGPLYLDAAFNSETGTLTLPAWTATVFVLPQS